MMTFVLSMFDVSSIQEYIFASNRLRENISASFLVEQASGAWLATALPLKHNLRSDGTVDDAAALETLRDTNADSCVAEVIYRGGGKLMVLFRGTTPDDALAYAHASAQHLSERILNEAPSLTLDVVHLPWSWSQALGGSNGLYAEALRLLQEAKLHRRPALGSVGLGVTLACRSTGLPAVAWDPEEPSRPVSAVVRAKVRRELRNATDERLYAVLAMSADERQSYDFSRDLDELGRSHGDMSYIAVVHADANGIGERFRGIAAHYPEAQHNRAFLNHLRTFSRALEQSGRAALRATKDVLLDLVQRPTLPDEPRASLLRSLSYTDDQRLLLPFRPLVFGGDDTTFVCDGRLGLTLAHAYLSAFDAAAAQHFAQQDILGPPPHACAGVAIVKTHYPFARAYALCEELCKQSKARVHALGSDQAALDWYIADTGIHGDLATMRSHQYTVNDGLLYSRPLLLEGSWPSWESFLQQVTAFTYAPEWRARHNKVLALYDALRQGRQATRAFRVAYGIQQLPQVTALPGAEYRETGWVAFPQLHTLSSQNIAEERICVYSDALEALEFMLPDPPYAEEATP